MSLTVLVSGFLKCGVALNKRLRADCLVVTGGEGLSCDFGGCCS